MFHTEVFLIANMKITMKIFFETTITMLDWWNFIISRCAMDEFHGIVCTSICREVLDICLLRFIVFQ